MQKYTAVIRTLGTAGEKYQILLNSLEKQTIKPAEILVYIAEGYALPKETVGREKYFFVKKGMVAQRALPYDEVTTPWILFLDDDVYLPPQAVQKLFEELEEAKAQVIAPDVFNNNKLSNSIKFRLALLGIAKANGHNHGWAYKIMRTSGFSYKTEIKERYALTQSNGGPCFMCKKTDFIHMHYEDEIWLDTTAYALPDDQVMFYKMHLLGLKQITSYDSGIKHLDAASTNQNAKNRRQRVLYSESKNRFIFWYRFIYKQSKGLFINLWNVLCIAYFFFIRIFFMSCKGHFSEVKAFCNGLCDGYKSVSTHKIERFIIPEK